MHNVLKLEDLIAFQNCIFVQDCLNKKLPFCFNLYFQLVSEIHSIKTKSYELGSIHIPYYATTKYGLNSITRKCIDIWNFFTKVFNCNLFVLTRSMIKCKICTYFTESY